MRKINNNFQIYCWTFFYLLSFCVINLSVSGLAMAFVRLLYVKAPNWIKFTLGERNLIYWISCIEMMSTLSLTILFGSEEAKSRAPISMCMSHQISKACIFILGSLMGHYRPF